ncbi:hypothetical protein BLNAU_23891 [Blattamonas nauphoetae]|uniref:Uncharacterized protein n=1 Tax=Blattamonas nauphoetae TaxID=2049346 RepID=A0ABQ9WP03_9EUKA|nr:hypothetical protein BLNAU_23891 [Blattamonas nauphoetae]
MPQIQNRNFRTEVYQCLPTSRQSRKKRQPADSEALMCSLTSAKAPSCVRLCRSRSPANLLSLHELIIISLSPSLRSNLPATVALLHSHYPILQQQSSPPPPQPDTRNDINQWLESVDERIEEQKAAHKQFMSCCSTCCI